MNRKPYLLAALWACGASAPGNANFVLEPTFEQKMALSQLVIIGTVTAIDRGAGRTGIGSTATLSVLRALKGDSPAAITVSTYDPIEELNPRCCRVGATYVMFLQPSALNGQLISVWGGYGMIRVGGPGSQAAVGSGRMR